jgi:uncharacterized membrane protein
MTTNEVQTGTPQTGTIQPGTAQNPAPAAETHPIENLTTESLDAMMRHALWATILLGLAASAALWIGSGWRNAAMLAAGAAISAASITEWQRLVRVINARMDRNRTPASAPVVVLFFVLRLTIFAGVIYGSLKCFRGSVAALLCGLALAVIAIGWQVLKLLRD